MATIVQETGAGLPNANCYVSAAFADAYFEGHPFYADAWGDLDPPQRESLLISATQLLDVQYIWYGYRATSTQALEWPRLRVRDVYDNSVPSNVIPLRLQQATCEQAYFLTRGDRSPEVSTSGGLERLKIDVIELEYSGSSTSASSFSAVPGTVRNLLRGLGDYAAGMRVRKVIVG